MKGPVHLLSLGFLLSLAPCQSFAQEAAEADPWPESVAPESSDANSIRLIDLHLKARGGAAQLAAVEAVRFSGTIEEGIIERDLEALVTRSGEMRLEWRRFHLGYDYLTVLANNGNQAWSRELLPEKRVPQKLAGQQLRHFRFLAGLPFLFLDHAAKGHLFAYKEKATYAGRPAYVLHGWLAGGMEVDIFIDAETFHVLNYRHPYRIGSETILVDRTPTALRREGGLWWESGYRIHVRGKAFERIHYSAINPDAEIPPEAFSLPLVREFWLRSRR